MIGTNNDDNGTIGKTGLGNRKMKLVKTSVEFSEMPLKVCLASIYPKPRPAV